MQSYVFRSSLVDKIYNMCSDTDPSSSSSSNAKHDIVDIVTMCIYSLIRVSIFSLVILLVGPAVHMEEERRCCRAIWLLVVSS